MQLFNSMCDNSGVMSLVRRSRLRMDEDKREKVEGNLAVALVLHNAMMENLSIPLVFRFTLCGLSVGIDKPPLREARLVFSLSQRINGTQCAEP